MGFIIVSDYVSLREKVNGNKNSVDLTGRVTEDYEGGNIGVKVYRLGELLYEAKCDDDKSGRRFYAWAKGYAKADKAKIRYNPRKNFRNFL